MTNSVNKDLLCPVCRQLMEEGYLIPKAESGPFNFFMGFSAGVKTSCSGPVRSGR